MTIADIANFACKTVGDVSSDMQAFAKDAIRLKYQTLYDAHAWRESMRVIELVLDPSLNGVFFIPLDTEEVIFCKLSYDQINYQRLAYRERDWVERISGGVGVPFHIPIFYRAENLAWPYLNLGRLTLSTSSLTSFPVHIEGLDANEVRIMDDFAMLAIQQPGGPIIPASVSTSNVYDKVTVLSKGAGTLSIFSERPVPTMTISVSDPERELVYSQFVIYPAPVRQAYVQLEVKLKPDLLGDDLSVPRISHIWDALIEFTLAALYTRTRQLTKADAREQKAMDHVKAAINIEKNQSESRQQVVPVIYETGNYLGRRYRPTSSYPWGY